MAQRISRAKQRIKDSGVPFDDAARRGADRPAAPRAARAVPDLQRGLRQQRWPQLHRAELSAEAIRLTRMLHGCCPTTARSPGCSRSCCSPTRAGRPAPAPTASWSRWPSRTGRCGTGALIAEGVALRHRALATGTGRRRTSCRPPSPPSTTRPPHADDTDWPQILALYELLEQLTGNPVVTLNRAVAAGMVHGPSRRPGRARRGSTTAGRPPPARRGPRPPAGDGR